MIFSEHCFVGYLATPAPRREGLASERTNPSSVPYGDTG